MTKSGVHLCPVYDGSVEPIILSDAYGPVCFYLLPFLKPSHVRRFFPDCEINTYTDALAAVIGAMQVDRRVRNTPVCHGSPSVRFGGGFRRRIGSSGRVCFRAL